MSEPDAPRSCRFHQAFQGDCIECVDNEIDRRGGTSIVRSEPDALIESLRTRGNLVDRLQAADRLTDLRAALTAAEEARDEALEISNQAVRDRVTSLGEVSQLRADLAACREALKET